ncbi:hypothetical protein N8927_02480 [Crocinitomicaceae bacterium]|nr:hypothetical protein [Crocinitomicaceae bacterium]
MTIQTIDELLDFIDTNYERLSDKDYKDLLKLTLQVYEFGKPPTKEETINRILSFYQRIEIQPDNYEIPLFMDENP